MLTPTADGAFQFRTFLPHAAAVELVGDFTGWQNERIRMTREPTGWWTVTATVPPGEHSFCYLADGHLRLADYAAHGVVLSPAGGWVSRIRVDAEPRSDQSEVALKPARPLAAA